MHCDRIRAKSSQGLGGETPLKLPIMQLNICFAPEPGWHPFQWLYGNCIYEPLLDRSGACKRLLEVLWRKGFGVQDSSLLRLASQQARRDEELNAARQRASELEAEVADLSREVELRQEQEQTLKEVRHSRLSASPLHLQHHVLESTGQDAVFPALKADTEACGTHLAWR